MAVIDSPGKPLFAPQESWRYCDTARVGSTADPETAKQKAARPTMAHLRIRRLPSASSWKVFKLLNHNLAWLLHRSFVARNDIKDQTECCFTRFRYPGRELMFRNELRSGTRRSSANGLERCMSRFPMQDKGKSACGRRKSEQVARNVERLDFILCIILTRSITPATNLNVHFAKVLFASPFVESKHAEDRGRFQVRSTT